MASPAAIPASIALNRSNPVEPTEITLFEPRGPPSGIPSSAEALETRDLNRPCADDARDSASIRPRSIYVTGSIPRDGLRDEASSAAPLARPSPPTGSRQHRHKALSLDTARSNPCARPLKSHPSRPSAANQTASLMVTKQLNAVEAESDRPRTANMHPRPAALSELSLRPPKDKAIMRYTNVQSPCFFHQRFDDAVNIDKVLEEIADDECMSHSRLMQTATGVKEVSKLLQRRPIKRAVRNVLIVTKAKDNQLVTLTRELAEWLLTTPRYGSDVGVNVYVDAKLRYSKRFNAAGLLDKEARFEQMLRYWTPDLCCNSPEQFDLVLTLGGDGTVLFTSWLFQRVVPPVLSFSLGSLGFLTSFKFEQFREHLDRVMGDAGMRVNLRMRFTCTIHRRDVMGGVEEGEQFEVLNELVIDRGPSPYVSNLELYGDDELLTVVQADGCIFSTPTGSTAYSLSAGGSLVHPDIPAILLTPICPHTLSFRPMLLNDTMLLRVCVPRASRATAYCSFDGKGRVELRQGDCVTIAASQYPFPTVLSRPTEWFDSISRTLRWNTRAAHQKAWGGGGGTGGGGGDGESGGHDGGAADGDSVAEDDDDNDEGWDIDTDTIDSGIYSEASSTASPGRRSKMALFS